MSQKSNVIAVNITFKNTEATDALKKYGADKIETCLRKFVHHDTEAHLVLKVEKKRQIAEVDLNADGSSFTASEVSDNMYKSIDGLVDTLSRQLRKHKEKLTRHH